MKELPALAQAVRDGDRARIEALVAAGEDPAYVGEHGYTALVDVLYGPHKPDLLEIVRWLIARGAPLDRASDWNESPVRVASRQHRFDVVRALLDAGADAAPLGWSPLHRAVAFGTAEDVAAAPRDLAARDCWSRTPWLLALQTGDLAKAEALRAAGADLAERDRHGRTSLHYAVDGADPAIVRWLLELGCDPDETDESSVTPLHDAAAAGETEIVRVLLDAGASVEARDYVAAAPIERASNLAIVRLLVERGADLQAINRDMRAEMLGLRWGGPIDATVEAYRAGARRRFGRSNPERIDEPFWNAMVRAGARAHAARSTFGEPPTSAPVWCFERYGQSITRLPDGRLVQIGGEHEDSYDRDFCIYNDVVVHRPDGTFELYGYPEDLFPPTDFHTATLIGDTIWIVGSLGYPEARRPGETQVFRLDLRTFAVERCVTRGDGPGWLSAHRAHLEGRRIVCRGGKIGVPGYVDSDGTFALDLDRSVWHRVT